MARPLRFVPILLVAAVAAWAVPQFRWEIASRYGVRGRGRNELREPVDVALLRGNVLAVLDRDREAIVLFDRDGRWLRSIGGRRSSVVDPGFDRPIAMEVSPRGDLWVVDWGNHRLVRLGEDGTPEQVIGTMGTAPGRFRRPSDLAFDPGGRLYVADTGNDRIQVFSRDGRLLDVWRAREAARQGHLDRPVALGYTARGGGRLWVLNRGGAVLERFDLEGRWERTLPLPPEVGGDVELVAFFQEPAFYRLFLSDAAGGRIIVLDRKGEKLDELRDPTGPMDPAGLVVTRRMDVFVADRAGRRALRFKTR